MTVKWECEFRKEIEDNAVLQTFIANLNVENPLDPREAFFGGRTNAAVLFYECGDDEQIKYADINR